MGVCSTVPAFGEPSETFSSVLLAFLFCEEESTRGQGKKTFLKEHTHKPSLLARTMADRSWPESQGINYPPPPPTTPGPGIPGSPLRTQNGVVSTTRRRILHPAALLLPLTQKEALGKHPNFCHIPTARGEELRCVRPGKLSDLTISGF